MPFWNVPSCNVNFLLLYQAEFNNSVIFLSNCNVTCSTMATSALAIFSAHWRLIKSCITAPVAASSSRIIFSFASHVPLYLLLYGSSAVLFLAHFSTRKSRTMKRTKKRRKRYLHHVLKKFNQLSLLMYENVDEFFGACLADFPLCTRDWI